MDVADWYTSSLARSSRARSLHVPAHAGVGGRHKRPLPAAHFAPTRGPGAADGTGITSHFYLHHPADRSGAEASSAD